MKKRYSVTLAELEQKKLEALSNLSGLKVSEIIRIAVEKYLERK